MKREKFATRTIYLVGPEQLTTALAVLQRVPLDRDKPLECLIREKPKVRGLDQNALMWVGPLADIAEQAWVEGRKYRVDVWHEYFKELYLPEDHMGGVTKEGYRKWDYTPDGKRVLVGSTTELLVEGFSIYLEQVMAHGASLGVQYHANPRERAAA